MSVDGKVAERRGWPTWAKVTAGVGLLWVVSDLVGCTIGYMVEHTPKQPEKAAAERVMDKIAPDTVIPMDRADYRKTFAKLGKKQFDNANDLMKWAAVAAAESDKCDKVVVVGISDYATAKELQWFVDCENKERFQIREAQAVAVRAKFAAANVAVAEPKSAQWKNFNERVAVSDCKSLVQSVMTDRGSFDAAWTWDSEKDDQTGRVTIQQDFEAKNGFGGTISSRYHCVIDTKIGGRIVKLKVREADGWRTLI
ncbi:hypothetical protein HGI47_09935 [Novosphingobium sp. ERN07]|uniref:hypothetical protein n=1 Tax=Novosphingobium sp. ERN07 TaxID=2726187 RepID=UPI0014572905|nr:hypothetical protein [Novosphingobium sp. ERN07]NLR71192.1 hypothetical protein [Novosphingobium sp. ERN07]